MDSVQGILFGDGSVGEIPSPHVRRERVFRRVVADPHLPWSLPDYLGEGHVAVELRELVATLDLSRLEAEYSVAGGVGYSPSSLLGVWLLGYALGVTSSRKLEEACRYDLRFQHVSGGVCPDYRTLARFRRRLGVASESLQREILGQCKEAGLLKNPRLAVDGTKIASVASQLAHWFRDAEIEALEDLGLDAPLPSDPDAHLMRSAKGFVAGYNVQAAVDMESGVVVLAEAFPNREDVTLLAPVLELAEARLGEAPSGVVADAGYDCYESHQFCASAGIDAVIAPSNRSSEFWTVTEEGIQCPVGRLAQPGRRTGFNAKGVPLIQHAVDCAECPFASVCSKTMRVPEGSDPAHRIQGQQKARSPEAKEAMQRRMATVEALFGRLKANRGYDRFRLRGKDGVRIELALLVLTENIAILFRERIGGIFAILGLIFRSCRQIRPQMIPAP